MSGCSYDTICPRCGGTNLQCYSDWKPYDVVSGECLDCGLLYYSKESRMTLEEVNEMRAEIELEPLEELASPTPEWIEYCGGREPPIIPEFTVRELALIALCVGFGKSNIEELEEVADEDISQEIQALLDKIEKVKA